MILRFEVPSEVLCSGKERRASMRVSCDGGCWSAAARNWEATRNRTSNASMALDGRHYDAETHTKSVGIS